MPRHTITIECKVLTPMFLVGADKDKKNEFRPESLVGGLRFWWRAANSHLSYEELHKKEGELFGDTSQRSGVSVDMWTDENDYEEILDHTFYGGDLSNLRANEGIQQKSGLFYFWSNLYGFNSNIDTKKHIKIGTTFKVRFSSFSREKLDLMLATFWLLAMLGGLGSRSRRGAGAFEVTGEHVDKFCIDNIEDLNLNIVEKLSTIRAAVASTIKAQKEYASFNNAQIVLSDVHNSWTDALKNIGESLKSHLKGLEGRNARDDYSRGRKVRVRDAMERINEKAWFGMPKGIQNQPGVAVIPHPSGNDDIGARLASPMIVNIVKSKAGYHYIALFTFSKQILPMPSMIKLDGTPSYDVKTKFDKGSQILSDNAYQAFAKKLKATPLSPKTTTP